MMCVHVAGTVSSSAAVSVPTAKPSPAFETCSNTTSALSAAPSVEQPFHVTGNWNAVVGFKFGGLTSQPLGSTGTVALSGSVSAAVSTVLSGSVTASSQQSTGLAVSLHSTDAVMSPAADTGSRDVDGTSGVEMPSCCSAAVPPVDRVKFTIAAADGNCDQLAVISNSYAVMPPVTSTTSSPAAAAAAAPVFSLPSATTFTPQPTSLFSFGQAAFDRNSSRPLGVPAASALQFSAAGCCCVTCVHNSRLLIVHS